MRVFTLQGFKKGLRITSRREKGNWASRVHHMIELLKEVDKTTLEDAFEHAEAVGFYDKDALLDYVPAFA